MHFNDLIWKIKREQDGETSNTNSEKTNTVIMKCHTGRNLIVIMNRRCAIRFSNFYLKQVAMFVLSLLVDDRLVYAERQIHMAWCRGGVATSYTILYLSWHGCECEVSHSRLFTNETFYETICTEQSEVCFIKHKSYADILTFVIIYSSIYALCTPTISVL